MVQPGSPWNPSDEEKAAAAGMAKRTVENPERRDPETG
jgi:hypothetical protein